VAYSDFVTEVPAPAVRRSAALTGFFTAVSMAVMTCAAAVAGAILARKFGRTSETDGFFTAYAVYILLVLAATAFRIVVLPTLARAAQAGRLAAEASAYAAAFALPIVPLLAISTFASEPTARLLTGTLPTSAQHTAAHALMWLVPAAVAQVYAGLAASSLAALDEYTTAAVAFAVGAIAALTVFVSFADAHGPLALAWGLFAGGFVTLAILAFELFRRRGLGRVQGVSFHLLGRLGELMQGVALPLALQGLYVIAVRFAADFGVGSVTSFSYAYLIAAALVALASSPLSLVSSVPLTRRGVDDDRAAVHVVSTSWLALTLVAGAAGVFALAGERVISGLLGPSYSGRVGSELGHLVVYLSPWMIASIGVSVTLPLLFVAGKRKWLPFLAVGALIINIPIEWAGKELFGLTGVAVGLAVTTVLVLGALLAALSLETLVRVGAGLSLPTLLMGALAAISFLAAARLLDPVPAAIVGLLLYAALLGALRPRGLRAAWSYMRALH
jgi:peptidoglycan biosynthesis protein MviN/MurJ (putative lipid II flippase)